MMVGAGFCCQQDPTAVLDPSLLSLTLPPDPMMLGLGASNNGPS